MNSPQQISVTRPIDDIDMVPDGTLLSAKENPFFPLSQDQMENVAILRADAGDLIYVTQEVSNGPSLLTIKSKYRSHKNSQYPTIKPQELKNIIATRTVIASIYRRDAARRSNTKGEDQTPAESMISKIVNAAHRFKASDIHIESVVTKATVFLRVNGSRMQLFETTHSEAYGVGSSMYTVHCDAGSKDISWNPEDVQDGAFTWRADDGSQYQFRFSSSPIYPQGGFQIVLRMISMEASSSLPLNVLGYTDHMIDQVDVMTSASSGMVLLCGATNSGKSTSMQAIIRLIYEKRGSLMKVITVEDPVEYVIPSACQISVPRRRTDAGSDPNNTPFTRFLRGTLRQDPDIVMVGEIRDNASASIVKDSVLAGRKLISTIHTYSTFGAFLRLREIGVPWEVMTMPGFISGLIYQRLVPTTCQHCSIPLVEDLKENPSKYSNTFMRRLNAVLDNRIADFNIRVVGNGCPKCRDSGIAGRTVCAEFNIPSRAALRLLADNKMLEAEEQWRSEGGLSALDHAISKMKDGIVSPFMIEENIGLLKEGII